MARSEGSDDARRRVPQAIRSHRRRRPRACGFCRNCLAGYTGFCLTVNLGFAGGAYGYVAMGWHAFLGLAIGAAPISYAVGTTQYLALVIGGSPLSANYHWGTIGGPGRRPSAGRLSDPGLRGDRWSWCVIAVPWPHSWRQRPFPL
jgi:hypothetical protein